MEHVIAQCVKVSNVLMGRFAMRDNAFLQIVTTTQYIVLNALMINAVRAISIVIILAEHSAALLAKIVVIMLGVVKKIKLVAQIAGILQFVALKTQRVTIYVAHAIKI